LLLFFVAYVVGGGIGQGLAIIPGTTVTYWPPSGFFVATLLLTPLQGWSWVVLTACAAEMTCNVLWFHSPAHFALLYFLANAIEATSAAALLRLFIRRPFRLDTLRQVLALALVGGMVAPALGATIIATIDTLRRNHSFRQVWQLVWLGDGSGLLVTTPVTIVAVQTWKNRGRIRPWRLLEASAVFLLLILLCYEWSHDSFPTLYLTMPVLLWAAVRFQLRGAAVALATTVVVCALLANPGTALGEQGLTKAELHTHVITLQTYFVVSSVSTLLVAALAQQHRQALLNLRHANTELEARVTERTASLRTSEAGLREREARLRESDASLRASEASLRASEARLRLFIENAPVAIAMFDTQMRYIAASRRWREDYRLGEGELVGRSHDELFPETPENWRQAQALALSGQTVRCPADRCQWSDGTVQFIRWEVLPWWNAHREVGGIMIAAEDITARKHAEDELHAARERAEQALAQAEQARADAVAATRAKDDFLARLSHELRTPLTPVLMLLSHYTQAADDHDAPGADTLAPQLQRDLAEIKRNVETEIRLIDDLLDLTRVVSGKLLLRHETVDMHCVIERAIGVCCDEIWQAKNLRLVTRLDADHSLVQGDPTRLEQVIWNLLRNAMKFTPPGGTVRIHTSNVLPTSSSLPPGTTTPDTSPPRLRIDVEDTGIGIPPESLLNIFKPFEQGTPDVTRTFGGLGMGLTICRTLVELHSGTICAASQGRDLGSRFTVELAALPSGAHIKHHQLSPDRQLARHAPSKHILLVEDDETTRRVLHRLLSNAGHSVHTASSIADAKNQARHHTFDIVVSDLGLPDGRGHDLMHYLRSEYRLPGIALSGFGTEQDIQTSLDAGFSDHLVKPVSLQRIADAIERLTRTTTPDSGPEHNQRAAPALEVEPAGRESLRGSGA
jgi:PAS domain S-box-containing protein